MENREKIKEAYEGLGLDWSWISLFIDFSNGFNFKKDIMEQVEAKGGKIEKNETPVGIQWRPAALSEVFPLPPGKKVWIEPKTWQEMRDAGMLFYVNLVLQPLGWGLCVEVDEQGNATTCKPARTKFRGFDEQSQDEEHAKIANYLAAAAPGFPEEIK